MAGKNNVKVGLIDGNSEAESVSEEKKAVLENASKKEDIPKDAQKGLIISVVDHPITIKYGNSKIRLSGRANEPVDDISKLGELPKGVKLKKL